MNDESKTGKQPINAAADKLSRTQIESALRAESDRSKRKKRKKPGIDNELPLSPRRQQVLGGDLTGVASRPKTILNRLADVSVVNWLVGIIVLAIVTAFFWPQTQPSVREVAGNQRAELEKIETDSQTIREVDDSVLGASTTFSRNDDINRANDYRELDAKELQIRKLLERAQEYTSQGKYTQPQQNNAVSAYQAALTIDPNNVDARQGLDYIAGRFQESGFSALQRNDVEAANTALQKLARIDSQSAEYLELDGAIETWKKQQKIDESIAQAEQALGQEKFILPAKDNALYFYQQALLLDESNEKALLGLQRIADNYIEQANSSLLNGEYQAARAHLATVSIIDPDHPSIELVETLMRKAEQQAARQATPVPERTSDTQNTPLSITRQTNPAKATNPERNTATDSKTSSTTRSDRNTRTPRSQSVEQQTVDKQYLKQGLDAYYKGDYELAARLLQPLADKGIARAQFRLAYMHYLGRGFKRDRQEADQIIRAALPAIRNFAEEGRAWAQSDLGSLYEDGLVLARNYAEAIYWYRSAAEQGYPGAQTNLGIMYARGRGVSSSRKTAIEWFQRAAKQGDIAAQRNLEALGVN